MGDSIALLSVFSNYTMNGRTIAMGTFKEYIDSSRKELLVKARALGFLKDKDTVCCGFNAHVFEFYGSFIYRKDTLLFTQLAVDATTVDLQYVLTFMRSKGTEKKYREIENVFFNSFRPSKKCGN